MAHEVSSQKLAEVLLDFGAAPGNFPVRMGEPHELYSELNTVALWALGRVPADVDGDPTELTEAARLFVRRACFAPDNTHYQVMALTPKAFAADELRSRYRSLIRLTHPDRGVPGLPANAAGIVNRAHEILSDPLLRSQYDEHLAERAAAALTSRQQPLQGPKLRRIEHRHGFADRWSSLWAQYPKLLGLTLSIGGVVAATAGLVIWAAQDGQEGRMLVIAGTEPEAPRDSGPTAKESAIKRPAAPAGARSGSEPPTRLAANTAALPNANPPRLASAPAPAIEPVRNRVEAERTGANAATPPSPAPAPAAANPLARSAAPDPRAPISPGPVAGATQPKLPAASTVRLPAPTPPVELPAPRVDKVQAAVQKAVPTAAQVPSQTLAPGMIKTEQVSAAAAAEAAPAVRLAQALPPPAPAPTSVAAPAPAPAPAPVPAPAPASARAPAVAPTPSPPPATPTAAAQSSTPPQPSTAPAGETWSVDSVRAKHYLIELVSKLSNPSATKATNRYLAGMNVTGSLFRPALSMQDRYSEISVESMRWSDSEQPGVLRVRGDIVLLGRSPNETPRTVRYGVSAEFWGTRSGTVLASLELRERE